MGLSRFLLLTSLLLLAGCGQKDKDPSSGPPAGPGPNGPGPGTPTAIRSLADDRSVFKTKLVQPLLAREPVDEPPAKLFRTVKFDSPVGKLAAYLTPDPKDGKKHPAIVWITGGDCNSIGDVWSPQPAKNDQTAAQYRQAGIVMMFPSLRGGNENPGRREGFFGEVDDVIAAAEFLAMQPYVDPDRIYLGGHSTGGTLVLLVAECSGRFRAVFSFGPVDDPKGYGNQVPWMPFDTSNPRELELRSPIKWLSNITSPTFAFEGASKGNIESLNEMARVNANPSVKFFPVAGADHFSLIAPLNRLIAAKILKDDGAKCNLSFTEAEANAAVRGK